MFVVHTLLLLVLIGQCVLMGLTTGKHTPFVVRLCLLGMPALAGAWTADLAYPNPHSNGYDVALLLGVIVMVEALRRRVGQHERNCEARELTRDLTRYAGRD